MSVHTLGNTTAPSFGANDTSAYNEIGPTNGPVMPADGYITQLAGYFGATSGSITANLLLLNINSLIAVASAQTVGGQAWQTATITPTFMGAGGAPRVGWFVSGEVHFSVYGSGTWQAEHVGGASNLNGFQPGSPYFQGGTGYYTQWIDPLSVSGVSPTIAGAGQSVTVSGGGFVGGSITSITFNGTAASSWTVNSDSSLTVTVPTGATSGALVVNSDHGSGSTAFTVSSAYAYDGSAFQTSQVYAYDGATFQICQVYIYDGANWQPSD